MYEKLIQQLAQLLRGNIVSDEIYPLAFQLLAWVRASKLGRLTGEVTFNPAAPPRDARHLFAIFSQIGSAEVLGENSCAFAYVSPALQHLTPGQVVQALELLADANLESPWATGSLTASMTSGSGKGVMNLPTELTYLMVGLLDVAPQMRVYLPFEQSFQLTAAVQAQGASSYAEVKTTWPSPWLINLLSDTAIHGHVGDSLERPGFLKGGSLTKFDVGLSFPPLGVKYDLQLAERDLFERFPEQTASIAVLAVRHILARTRGRSVVAVPNGVLFSPGAERALRENLLIKKQIEAVVGLPPALLSNTALPFSLLVLNHERASDQVIFVDAAQDSLFRKDGKGRAVLTGWVQVLDAVLSGAECTFSRKVSTADVLDNDAQLQVSRYCTTAIDSDLGTVLQKYPVRMLAELVSFVRPLPTSPSEGDVRMMEVGPADFPDFGYAQTPGRAVLIAQAVLTKGRKQLLRPFDIAITIKGGVGKVAILPPEIDAVENSGWVVGQSCVVLRVDDEGIIDPRVLFSFLRSEFGQAQLKRIVSGASVPLILLRDLEKIKIPVPSRVEQDEAIKVFEKIVEIERLVASYRDEQQKLSNAIWTI